MKTKKLFTRLGVASLRSRVLPALLAVLKAMSYQSVMRAKALPLLLMALSLVPLNARANDIEYGKEYYTALRTTSGIVVDGNLSEWTGVPVLADPKFAVPKGSGAGGNFMLFEPYAGGTWTGPEDQSSAVQVIYDADNVYFGFVVTDDYHENSANSFWNGDSIQLMIANSNRTAQVALYNYALGGVEGTLGSTIVDHEAGPGGTTAVVTRDGINKKTTYEIMLPASSLGLTAPLTVGTQFGLGMAINDGDLLQPGQRGWGGWGAHAVVYGKTPRETGLVTLGPPPQIAVEQPAGSGLTNGSTRSLTAVPGGTASLTFTIKNTGLSVLIGLTITKGGSNASEFAVTSSPTAPVSGPSGSTTFTVRFAPTASGIRTAAIHIASNDPDNNPFDINLTGRAMSFMQDADGDGLNDAAEFQLAALGFDWQVSQTNLVNTYFSNANGAGLYTMSQIQALNVGTPLLAKDPLSNLFRLTIGVQKSTDLTQFSPFQMTAPQTLINTQGELEFRFSVSNNAAFFRLQSR